MKKIIFAIILTLCTALSVTVPAFAGDPCPPNTTCVETNLNDVPKCFGGGQCVQQASSSDLVNFVRNLVRFVGVGVGALIVLMFGFAGFLYLTAGGNSNQIARAKGIFGSLAFTLFLYIFGLAIMNWLLPGGVVGF